MSNRALARTELAQAAIKKLASMRCFSSKLQTRARILELGLNAAQPRNCPSAESTRTVSPLSPPPLAMADSKIQGWPRSSERSLPARSRMVFMGAIVAWGGGRRLGAGDAGRHGTRLRSCPPPCGLLLYLTAPSAMPSSVRGVVGCRGAFAQASTTVSLVYAIATWKRPLPQQSKGHFRLIAVIQVSRQQ